MGRFGRRCPSGRNQRHHFVESTERPGCLGCPDVKRTNSGGRYCTDRHANRYRQPDAEPDAKPDTPSNGEAGRSPGRSEAHSATHAEAAATSASFQLLRRTSESVAIQLLRRQRDPAGTLEFLQLLQLHRQLLDRRSSKRRTRYPVRGRHVQRFWWGSRIALLVPRRPESHPVRALIRLNDRRTGRRWHLSSTRLNLMTRGVRVF
jgi:hypothetical protein